MSTRPPPRRVVAAGHARRGFRRRDVPRPASGLGCAGRALRAYGIFLVLAAVIPSLVGHVIARRDLARTEQAWAEAGESMEAFDARFPTRADSPAAERLHELTRPLTVRMLWRVEEDDLYPDDPDPVLMAMGAEISELRKRREAALPALSSASRSRLREARGHLDAIENLLLSGDPIHWRREIRLGFGSPLLGLLGQRLLQNLLLARAWDATLAGRHTAAARSLEASWALNASLADHPELIAKLIRLAIGQMQYDVLRGVRASEAWPERLASHSWSSELHEAFQLEAWDFTRAAVDGWGLIDIGAVDTGELPERGPLGRIGRFLTAPYVSLSMSNLSEHYLEASRYLASQPCGFDVEAYSESLKAAMPVWNFVGKIAIESPLRAATSMKVADLDRELTLLVLRAREVRRRSGRWPVGRVTSEVCPELGWAYRAAPDGSMALDVVGTPFPQAEKDEKAWSVRLRP